MEKYKVGDILMQKTDKGLFVFEYKGESTRYTGGINPGGIYESVILGNEIVNMNKKIVIDTYFYKDNIELAPKEVVDAYKEVIKEMRTKRMQENENIIKPFDFVVAKHDDNNVGIVLNVKYRNDGERKLGLCLVYWINRINPYHDDWVYNFNPTKVNSIQNLLANFIVQRDIS